MLVAWVDPVNGGDATGEVQDPDLPFKTLQKAIDDTFNALIVLGAGYGEVRALPGVYGPANVVGNGPNSSGDVFPVVMRDRVSVQGVGGARRCVIRGTGSPTSGGGSGIPLRWPDSQFGRNTNTTSLPAREVLIDMSSINHATRYAPNTTTPWYDPGNGQTEPPTPEGYDAREVLNGFTLQGGDVQVLFLNGGGDQDFKPRGVVSNCIFDMRHQLPGYGFVPVPGPWFGIMMCKQFTTAGGWNCSPSIPDTVGYLDQEVLILNNTFILSQYFPSTGFGHARNGAVGIIDVTDPMCSSNQGQLGHGWDCDDSFRGLGNPAIVNNLFRTGKYETTPSSLAYAMLGVDLNDTLVRPPSGPPVQSNVFATARVGTTNGLFWSQPVANPLPTWISPAIEEVRDLWDCAGVGSCGGTPFQTQNACAACTSPVGHTCQAGTFPIPKGGLEIWDGNANEIDPGFVGEFMMDSTFGQSFGLGFFSDWRLLPDSPLKDQGHLPDADDPLVMENGVDYGLVTPMWDHEHWGNPRVIGDAIDIGADEIHLFTMTGSWGIDSQSHNEVPSLLNPDASTGVTKRAMILPEVVNTSLGTVNMMGKTLRVHGVIRAPASSTPPAWSFQPPALVDPASNPNLPRDYRTKYITFSNPGSTPTPWEIQTISTFDLDTTYKPIGGVTTQPSFRFVRVDFVTDQECPTPPCDGDYFITQPIIKDDTGATLLRGNMQAEYR